MAQTHEHKQSGRNHDPHRSRYHDNVQNQDAQTAIYKDLRQGYLLLSFTWPPPACLKFKRKSNRSHANQAHYRCPRLRFHLPADETEYFTVFPEIRDYVYCRVKRVHEWGVPWAEE